MSYQVLTARKNKRNVREELNAQGQLEDESGSAWTGAKRNELASPLSTDGAVGQTKVDHTPQRSEKFYALSALPLGLPSAEQLRQAMGAILRRIDNNKVTSAGKTIVTTISELQPKFRPSYVAGDGPVTPPSCAMRDHASVRNHQTTECMHQPTMDDRVDFHPTSNGSRPVPQPMYDFQFIPQWDNSRPMWVKAKDVISEFDGNGPVHPMEIISQLEMAVRSGYLPADQVSRCLCQQLRGSAFTWGQAMLRTDDSVETVCSKFIERFWSRDQQIDARLKLETDRYVYSKIRFLDHFCAAWSTARCLILMYPEEQLLSIIARHYPPNIQIGLRGKNVEVSSSTKAHRTGPEAQRFERPHVKFSTQTPRERVAVLDEEETEDAGIVVGNGSPRVD
ncbi:hypothetical protein CBL_06369 [Carabus blaptoides fortunei]